MCNLPQNFRLFQINVKSAFLNGYLNEVSVAQSPSFENVDFSYHVFKIRKVLYDLKQAPCSWYEMLSF